MTDAAMDGVNTPKRSFDRYSEFYQSTYGTYIRGAQSLGPIDIMDIHQPCGDFSDKGTSDISLQRALSSTVLHADFGAGRFSTAVRLGDIFVSPCGYDNAVVIETENRLDVLAIRWSHIETLRAAEARPMSIDLGPVLTRANRDQQMCQMLDRLWTMKPEVDALQLDQSILWISHRLDAWRDGLRRRGQI